MEQIVAITNTGKRVVLNSDQTWEYESNALAIGEEGFRNAKWGMSKAETKRSEDLQLIDSNDSILLYKIRMADKDFDIIYIFVDDQLVRAKYILVDRYTNENTYLWEADKLRDAMTAKYGVPVDHNEYWLGDTWKNDLSNRGRAVEAGELALYTNWQSGDTHILLAVTGENYETVVTLEYLSTSLSALEDAKRESNLLDNL